MTERPDPPVPSGSMLVSGTVQGRIPLPKYEPKPDPESLDVWGFPDSGFEVTDKGVVKARGHRYEISGSELPDLLPWMRGVIEVDLDAFDVHESQYPGVIPAPVVNDGFRHAIADFLDSDQIDDDDQERLRRGHGHTQEEMYAIKYGALPRIPDLIVFPGDDLEIAKLVQAAIDNDVVLVPYGGGTNVTEALRCDPDETRMIVAVDMLRMDQVLWIDPTNLEAGIQAGAVGRHLTDRLAEFGFTMGHEPDSLEFSTLGGWIATHASGMKKNRYGNIEDLITDVTVVTRDGVISRNNVGPRESIGADPRRFILGSEGNLGIITQATVKIFPLPEVQKYQAILFPTFADGVAFMYDLTRSGNWPASARLVDNLQFQLSQTLKAKSSGLSRIKSHVEKLFVTRFKGFKVDQMVACTLVFEGSEEQVTAQEATVKRLSDLHKGMAAGSDNGKRGYQLTYGIAYIRDFIMRKYILAESFETSMPWDKVIPLVDRVKARITEEHHKRNLPGVPFITARVTQIYDTGAVVYFYFAFYHKGVENPSEVYADIERAARDEILNAGGSLSHHHGIGHLRKDFLPRVFSNAALGWNRQLKNAVDPGNNFGTGSQGITEPVPTLRGTIDDAPATAGDQTTPQTEGNR